MADAGQIGKYQIVAPLGSGGFATVYKALDTSLGREVALKILHPQLLVDKGFVERFFREARTLAGLRHPNIIIIHEVGSAEGRTFLAMELAASSLAQLIAAEGPRGWSEVSRLIDPAAAALEYAHERGVVHRDVKPANILLADDGRVLLTDFGFARAMGDVNTSMSVSSAILGTPSYIAPELWDGKLAGIASDIYALACVAYELFTGRVLFPGSTPLRAVAAHAVGPRLPEEWSPAVLAVFRKALAREPEERFQRASLFAGALREATRPAITPAQAAPSSPPMQTAAQLVAAPPKPRAAPDKPAAQAAEPTPEPQAGLAPAPPLIAANPVATVNHEATPPARSAPATSASTPRTGERQAWGHPWLATLIGMCGWAAFGLFIQQYASDGISLERLLINATATLLTCLALLVGGIATTPRQWVAFAAASVLPSLFLFVSKFGYFPFPWAFTFLPVVGLLVAFSVSAAARRLHIALGLGVLLIFCLSVPLAYFSYQFVNRLLLAQTGKDYTLSEALATAVALALQACFALTLTFALASRERRSGGTA